MRHVKAALSLTALFLATGGSALAHPPPEGTALVWVSAKSGDLAGSTERLFVRTQRGFLVESPATNDFRFLCNTFLGVQDGEDASLADLGEGAAILTTYAKGAMLGSSDGCTWSPITTVATAPAFDVTVVGTGTEKTAYVVGGAPHTGDHFWAGRNAGTRWSPLANTDEPYTRIRGAGTTSRLYLSGMSLTATGTIVHRLGISDDGGKTVVDRLITLGKDDLQARLLDADPVHPDRVYIYVESNSNEIAEHVTITEDAGRTFTTAVTMHAIGGFAQSNDGSRVWVGGREGIYRSSDGGRSFAPVASPMTTVTCLAFHQGRLFACGFLDNQLMVAVSDDNGDSFEKILSFDQVTQAADCPSLGADQAPSAVCADDMADWRSELGTADTGAAVDGGAPALDSGPPSGSGGNDGHGSSGPSTASACALGGADHGPGGVLGLLVFVAVFIWRRQCQS